MHRMRSVGALVAAAAIGVGVWLLSPAFACSPGAQLTVEGVAVPGQQATVHGSLFNGAAGEAKIWWNNVNGLLLGHVQPNSEGQFVTVITIPASAVPGEKAYLRASQAGTSGPSEPNEVAVVSQPSPPPAPPLASTATVSEPAPAPVVTPAPASQPEVEVASTPVPMASAPAPVAASGSEPSPLAVSDPSELGTPQPDARPLADRAVPVGTGLTLGQPADTAVPIAVPAGDESVSAPVVSGVPSVVGIPGQPGVVLGTPPATDLGAGRTSLPLVVGAAVLGLALLGLGVELARRRATAQA